MIRVATAGCVLLVAAVVVGNGANATRAFPRFGSSCAREDISVGKKQVWAELCRPDGPYTRAVAVFHGCGGFSSFDHRLVVSLPSYGIATLDVDYFALTPPPGRHGFCHARGAFDAAFGKWVQVASAATLALDRLVGPAGAGLVGWSLGGGVVVAAAEQPAIRRRIGAIAGFSTGSFGAELNAGSLPPTILLSGGRTDAIPVAETLPLYRALRRAHVPAALFVYPHGSHNWPGVQGAAGIARAAAFLRRRLR